MNALRATFRSTAGRVSGHFYLDNGELKVTHQPQNAILKKYGKELVETGTAYKAIFPADASGNEATEHLSRKHIFPDGRRYG